MDRGYIKIKTLTKKRDDLDFNLKGESFVRFSNYGQNYIKIDESEIIGPGESFVEGDVLGPGIHHKYRIEFMNNPAPPAVNKPLVYSGNHLFIRILKRAKNAGI